MTELFSHRVAGLATGRSKENFSWVPSRAFEQKRSARSFEALQGLSPHHNFHPITLPNVKFINFR